MTVTAGGSANTVTTTTLTAGSVGSFTLTGLATGSVTLTFSKTGYTSASVPVTLTASGPPAPVAVTLTSALGNVTGRVSQNGAGVPGATVQATDGTITRSHDHHGVRRVRRGHVPAARPPGGHLHGVRDERRRGAGHRRRHRATRGHHVAGPPHRGEPLTCACRSSRGAPSPPPGHPRRWVSSSRTAPTSSPGTCCGCSARTRRGWRSRTRRRACSPASRCPSRSS